MFESPLLVAVKYVRLSSEVRLKADGLAIWDVASHREDCHLREYEVFEFLYALYLAPCLNGTWPLHSHESYRVAGSHPQTVNEVARDQNSRSAETCAGDKTTITRRLTSVISYHMPGRCKFADGTRFTVVPRPR